MPELDFLMYRAEVAGAAGDFEALDYAAVSLFAFLSCFLIRIL